VTQTNSFAIRPVALSDVPSLYRICLLTGDAGGDASHLYKDPDLLGHVYAGPYVFYDRDVCFVLTNNGKPCGYIVATKSSNGFDDWTIQHWYPALRRQYAVPDKEDRSPDAQIIRHIHAPPVKETFYESHPAHLHIDILPEGQGGGWGRQLISTLIRELKRQGVSGVHLGVGKENTNAVGFYRHFGFEVIEDLAEEIIFGYDPSRLPT